MTGYVFPTIWFPPARFSTPELVSRTFTGGVSISGAKVIGRTDGGGLWRVTFLGVTLNSAKALRAWDAWYAILDGGVTKVVVGKSMGARAPALAGVAVPEQTFSDPFPHVGASYSPTGPIASTTIQGSPALRATQVTIRTTKSSSVGLTGGEHFAVNHATNGWRRYLVGEVVSTTDNGTTVDHVVNIRPPLREAISSGTAVDFNGPACTMICESMTRPDELRYGTGDITFLETFP